MDVDNPFSDRLRRLGLALPAVPAPVAVYVPAVRVTGSIYTSGQLPTVDGQLIATGKVGAEVSEETAIECARVAALNAVAAVVGTVDDPMSVRVTRVGVFVASVPTFTRQARVANGASELLGALFEDAGVHARSAVGVTVLPLDAPVEVEVTVAVHPSELPVAFGTVQDAAAPFPSWR
jgi:enamine deaminase RidA (YjgF/YER057c/UK114 family)